MKKAERFVRALEQAEREHELGPLVEMFSDDAELRRINSEEPYHGSSGARDFWSEYLGLFQEICSRFNHVVEADGTAVLEWEASGRFESGAPIHYRGVSVIEFEGDKVRAFRTYYDSAAFTQHAHA
jgi:ketosteroid isomerase-like protein